jgi:hypothetical protein
MAADEDDDEQQDDGRRLIVGTTRWGRVRLRLRSDDGLHYGLDDAPPASLGDRVLMAVRNDPGRSGSDIVRKVTGRKSDILSALREHARTGRIEERHKGWWPARVPKAVPDTNSAQVWEPLRELALSGLEPAEPIGNRAGTDVGTDGSRHETPGISLGEPTRPLVEPGSDAERLFLERLEREWHERGSAA